tara:strand:+ start:398 stop:823 length:426 start_codon:yes stop_codon:yes gene_type:complete
MSLPQAVAPEEISRGEVDHVLVLTLAYFQMDSQPLVPLEHGVLPLSALPAVDAAAQVGRAPDGSCGSGASLLVVADQRVPSLTLSTFKDKIRQNCFSRIWRLVQVAEPLALPRSAVPKLGDPLVVISVALDTQGLQPKDAQ